MIAKAVAPLSLITALLACTLISTAYAASTNVRMYKLNKKDQKIRIILRSNVEQPGCHNMPLRGKKVVQFAQKGFAWCSVYSEKNCKASSIIPALWTGKRYRKIEFDQAKPQQKLFVGSDWQLQTEDERTLSWYCEAK